MNETLNKLFAVERAVRDFKSAYTVDRMLGWSFDAWESKRVQLAIREIKEVLPYLDKVRILCRPESEVADGRAFFCPSCGKEHVVDVRQVFYRDNPEDRGAEKKYELFCDCVEHNSLRDEERELVRLKPKES